MVEDVSSREFDLHVLSRLEKHFNAGELQTTVARSEGPGGSGKHDPSVMVIHLPTGKKATCADYQTQIRNKVACLLMLLFDTPRSL